MGIVKSILIRPLKHFNIENRAHKLLNRDKPISAPTFESSRKQLEIAQKVNPDFLKEHYTKDKVLYDRLKEVYVDSYEMPPAKLKTSRPLPTRTRSDDDKHSWDFMEPKTVKEGRCTLLNVLKMLDAHTQDPDKYTAEELAKQYKLDIKDTSNILIYYSVFKYDKPTTDETGPFLDVYEQIGEDDVKEAAAKKELEK